MGKDGEFPSRCWAVLSKVGIITWTRFKSTSYSGCFEFEDGLGMMTSTSLIVWYSYANKDSRSSLSIAYSIQNSRAGMVK
jgi:hypothetical protein